MFDFVFSLTANLQSAYVCGLLNINLSYLFKDGNICYKVSVAHFLFELSLVNFSDVVTFNARTEYGLLTFPPIFLNVGPPDPGRVTPLSGFRVDFE